MKERIKYQRAKSYLRANVEALTENTSNTRGFNKLIRSAEYPWQSITVKQSRPHNEFKDKHLKNTDIYLIN